MNEYRVSYGQYSFRVRREKTQSGVQFFLRKFGEAHQLDARFIPSGFIQQLRSPALCRGGLILISGANGAGKTTTAASTVISRLHDFGGVAWTIEDPLEFLMEGKHGPLGGLCWQKAVIQGGFGQAMRDVMRCYPATAAGMLFVGELRDAETADQCLKAASNGLLVIATVHSGSIPGTVERFVNLTSEADRSNVRNTMAANLRMIVYQRRPHERPETVKMSSLWVNKVSHSAAAIREGNYSAMLEDVQFQANKLRSRQPICE